MSTPFELPTELTIYGAIESREALLAWLTEQAVPAHETLELSAAEVAEVDGSGLQLLAALTNMGQSWRLIAASAAFVEACRMMGLTQWVEGVPEKAPTPESAA